MEVLSHMAGRLVFGKRTIDELLFLVFLDIDFYLKKVFPANLTRVQVCYLNSILTFHEIWGCSGFKCFIDWDVNISECKRNWCICTSATARITHICITSMDTWYAWSIDLKKVSSKTYIYSCVYKQQMRLDKLRQYISDVQSKNAVCANNKHTFIKCQISGQSTTMVKGCMDICLTW